MSIAARLRRLALVAAWGTAAWGLLACGSTSPHLLKSRTAPLLSIFESEGALHSDPARFLAGLRSLGVTTVRVYMPWTGGWADGLAPAPNSLRPPAGFNGADPADYPADRWASYDAIFRDAAQAGLQVDLTIGGPPPLWARGSGDPGTGTSRNPSHPQWRPDAAAFGRFIVAVGRRYSGLYRDPRTGQLAPRVSFWAIWNEPNFGPSLAPQALSGQLASPALYRNLLDAAWGALAATGHGADTILFGELAPYGQAFGRGPGRFGYSVPLRFLRTLYCVDPNSRPISGPPATAVGCPPVPDRAGFRREHPALFRASGLALHPYAQGPPAVSLPGEPDYANLASLGHVERTIDGARAAYGVQRRLPLYSTEFGIHTNPPETVPGTVSPAQAAVFLNQAEYLTWRDPRLRSFDQYQLTDGPTPVFATGLEFFGGRPKATLAAYRMPIYLPVVHRRGSTPLEVWGAVRPARSASGAQRVALQFRAAGSAAFRTVRLLSLPAASVYFDVLQRFRAAGTVRTVWRARDGRTYSSRIVQIT